MSSHQPTGTSNSRRPTKSCTSSSEYLTVELKLRNPSAARHSAGQAKAKAQVRPQQKEKNFGPQMTRVFGEDMQNLLHASIPLVLV